MKLHDFVSETLKQIIEAVSGAQKHAEKHDAMINPLPGGYDPKAMVIDDSGRKILEVDFDVAVTSTESSEVGGGIGVSIIPFAAGAKSKSGAVDSYANRIKFSVPIVFSAKRREPRKESSGPKIVRARSPRRAVGKVG